MKSLGNISTAQLPDYRLDPPEDEQSSVYDEANEIVCNFEFMLAAIRMDLHSVNDVIGSDEKPIRMFGSRFTVCDALVLAACCLDAEQRRVILDDVRDYYIDFVVNQLEK